MKVLLAFLRLAEVEKITDEHECRTKFLEPENANGEVADFHSLRHKFITMLASSGVHPKIMLTMDRYSHARADLNSVVENLPSLTLSRNSESRMAEAVFGDFPGRIR